MSVFIDPSEIQDLFKNLVSYSKAYTMPYDLNDNGEIDTTASNTISRQINMDAITSIPKFIKVMFSDEYEKVKKYSDEKIYSPAYGFTIDYYKYLDTFTTVFAILRTITKIRQNISDPYSLPTSLVDEYLLSFGFNHYNLVQEKDKREVLRTINTFYQKKGSRELLYTVLSLMGFPKNETILITYWISYDPVISKLRLVGVEDETHEVYKSVVYDDGVENPLTTDPLWQLESEEVREYIQSGAGYNKYDSALKTPYFSLLSKQDYNNILLAWIALSASLRRERISKNSTAGPWISTSGYSGWSGISGTSGYSSYSGMSSFSGYSLGVFGTQIPSVGYEELMNGQSAKISLTEIFYAIKTLNDIIKTN